MNINCGVRGSYRFKVKNPKGDKVLGFKNLLTNEWFSGEHIAIYCRVGTGATPPQNSDTSLESEIAISSATTNVTEDDGGITGTIFKTRTISVFEFAIGGVIGNISEVGVSQSTTTNLLSRALILDDQGNPTTITLTADDQLVVEWIFEAEIETRPAPFNIDVDGVTTEVTFKYYRPQNYRGNYTSDRQGSDVSKLPYFEYGSAVTAIMSDDGTVNEPADGVWAYATLGSTTGDYYLKGESTLIRDHDGIGGTSSATAEVVLSASKNFTGNKPVGWILWPETTSFVTSRLVCGANFNPPIPKTVLEVITFDLTHTWSRI